MKAFGRMMLNAVTEGDHFRTASNIMELLRME